MNDATTLPVLVPAPAGSATELIARLREMGLSVDHSPFLELRAQRDTDTRRAVEALAAGQFAHLVVDSRRAAEVLASYDGSTDSRHEVTFAVPVAVTAVGQETATALRELGVFAARVAADSDAAIARDLPEASTAGESLLLVCGAATDASVRPALEAKGYTVTQATAYRPRSVSLDAQLVRDLRLRGYGALALTTPMLASLAGHLGIHRDIRVLTRDAAVTAAAEARGLVVHGEATEPTEASLAEAVRRALAVV
ncbi:MULTISPECIES: uroporphyrinogen-III synthase [unclassified Brachybacterium]|uniref:uroporphyrinogen-III synthase n=1 Tax=unclassified Brachybacterium TaxID=2623841 RepID=UPI0036153FD5